MLKNTLIIALIVLAIYLYYQQKKNTSSADYQDLQNKFTEVVKVNKIFAKFCQEEIGGKDIEEIRTKLNGRKLSELLEQNEELQSSLSSLDKERQDYELEVDTLRRSKGVLEAYLLAQSNSYKSSIKEKEGQIQRTTELLKKSEGQIKKLEQEKKDLGVDLTAVNKLLTEQEQKITDLETSLKQREKLFQEAQQTKSDLADYKEEVKQMRESKKELVAKVQALEKEVKAKDIVGPQQLQKFRDTFIALYPRVNPSAQEQVSS